MTKQEKAAMYETYLRKRGYQPRLINEEFITFKKEGVKFVLWNLESDINHIAREIIRLSLINLDRQAALEVCNAVAGEHRVAKVVLFEDCVFASCERFVDGPKGFRLCFDLVLQTLNSAAERWMELVCGDRSKDSAAGAMPEALPKQTPAQELRKSQRV